MLLRSLPQLVISSCFRRDQLRELFDEFEQCLLPMTSALRLTRFVKEDSPLADECLEFL